jgi:hypothetical protein
LHSIDLLVLDVEGTELDVIAGMRGSPVLPRVFCVEHGHLGIGVVRQAVEPLGYRYDTRLRGPMRSTATEDGSLHKELPIVLENSYYFVQRAFYGQGPGIPLLD